MARIGVLTFSDGRDFVARDLVEMNEDFQRRLRARLEAAGHEVVTGEEIVWTTDLAECEARRLAERGCDATIFNYAVWAFPHFSAIASTFAPRPILMFSNVNPRYPGLVAMLAAAGSLNQLGISHDRVWGEIEEPAVAHQVSAFARAAEVAGRLRGQTYGLVGGRSMGMYTATVDPAGWQRQFGVDVEHIDQWEIVRRGELVDASRVRAGREWLEHWGNVAYDGDRLTPDILERQVRSYHAMRELIDEWDLDFCGIKGQPELTNHYATMDIAEAFLNDPYDWEGAKEPIVCATEADSDGALTMQILKLIAGTPVLFADVRHYEASEDFFDLCNSGQHATFFAARSTDPADNMPHVRFLPEIFYFPAGGASVHHLAAPGEMTFARLTRKDGRYWMAILRGESIRFGDERDEGYMRATTWEWPHLFARFEASAETFLRTFAANHIHGVYGDQTAELVAVCRALGVTPVLLDGAGAHVASTSGLPQI